MSGTPESPTPGPEISIEGGLGDSRRSSPVSGEPRGSAPALEGDFHPQGSGSALDAAFRGKRPGTLDATMDGEGNADDGPFRLTQQHDNSFLYYRARHAAQDALNRKIITLNNEKRIELGIQGRKYVIKEHNLDKIFGQWLDLC